MLCCRAVSALFLFCVCFVCAPCFVGFVSVGVAKSGACSSRRCCVRNVLLLGRLATAFVVSCAETPTQLGGEKGEREGEERSRLVGKQQKRGSIDRVVDQRFTEFTSDFPSFFASQPALVWEV